MTGDDDQPTDWPAIIWFWSLIFGLIVAVLVGVNYLLAFFGA